MDGRSLSITDYAELFGIIGETFGSNSSDTFNIPDCRGRTLGAAGQGSGLSSRSIGDAVGSEHHILTTNEMPRHTHTGTTSTIGGHSHAYNDSYFAEAGGNQINGNNVFGTSGANDNDNQFRWMMELIQILQVTSKLQSMEVIIIHLQLTQLVTV
jgi:microcystin-dependent protein